MMQSTVYILTLCVCVESKVRLATLELSCLLLKQSVLSGDHCIIKDVHLACLEVQSTPMLHSENYMCHQQQKTMSNEVSRVGFSQ